MWIKICANTSLADARLAAELGAHAVGFVFATSSRQVTPVQVGAITPQLPAHVERIGVFDSQDADEIVRSVTDAGLTGIQLHGSLNPDLVRRLHNAFSNRIMLTQTIHWQTISPAESLRSRLREIRREPAIGRVLIDSRFGAAAGGTGIAFDWRAAAEVLRTERGDLRVIVAGGLRPENVAEAIEQLQPWGVDVATGVEASPGKKDPEKLEALIKRASL